MAYSSKYPPQIPIDEPIYLGLDSQGQPVYVALADLSNPHMCICGKSGSGKTHILCHIIDAMVGRGLTFHIIGFHADFSYDDFVKRGATRNISPDKHNHFKFQYSNSDLSLNPFSFSREPDNGGIVSAIKQIVNVVQLFHKSLGEKQTGYLERCLMEVYNNKGFTQEDMSTWANQKFSTLPDFNDLLDMLDSIYSNLSSELNESVYTNIRSLKRKIYNNREAMADVDSSLLRLERVREEYKENIKALHQLLDRLIEQDSLGIRGSAFYSDWDRNTVNSLRDVINRMIQSTLFTGAPAIPEEGKINFYDISKLDTKDKETLTYILFNKIYNKAVIDCGDNINPLFPSTYIVADEGRYIASSAKSPTSPVNEIMGGARKFGLGLAVGIQGAHQMSKDMSDNFALKIVVKSDESSESEVRKAFGLNGSLMKKLIAKKNMWVNDGRGLKLVEAFKE